MAYNVNLAAPQRQFTSIHLCVGCSIHKTTCGNDYRTSRLSHTTRFRELAALVFPTARLQKTSRKFWLIQVPSIYISDLQGQAFILEYILCGPSPQSQETLMFIDTPTYSHQSANVDQRSVAVRLQVGGDGTLVFSEHSLYMIWIFYVFFWRCSFQEYVFFFFRGFESTHFID